MAKGYANFGDPEAVVGRSGDKYGSYPGRGTTRISRLQSELANAELKKSRGADLPVIDHPPTNLFDPGPTDQSLPGFPRRSKHRYAQQLPSILSSQRCDRRPVELDGHRKGGGNRGCACAAFVRRRETGSNRTLGQSPEEIFLWSASLSLIPATGNINSIES